VDLDWSIVDEVEERKLNEDGEHKKIDLNGYSGPGHGGWRVVQKREKCHFRMLQERIRPRQGYLK
jgi:hypothetical protein